MTASEIEIDLETDTGPLSFKPYLITPRCDSIFRAPLSTISAPLWPSLTDLQFCPNLFCNCLRIFCHYVPYGNNQNLNPVVTCGSTVNEHKNSVKLHKGLFTTMG